MKKALARDVRTVLPYTWPGLVACLFWLLAVASFSREGGWLAFISFLFFAVMVAATYTVGVITSYLRGQIDFYEAFMKEREEG